MPCFPLCQRGFSPGIVLRGVAELAIINLTVDVNVSGSSLTRLAPKDSWERLQTCKGKAVREWIDGYISHNVG